MNRKPRYYRKDTIKKQSRTIKLPGDGKEPGIKTPGGELYRCWNCGFICNENRDSLGDGLSKDGITYSDYIEPSIWRKGTGDESTIAVSSMIGDLSHNLVSVPLDSDGNPKLEPHVFDISGTGCPFCHTLNWRGDY